MMKKVRAGKHQRASLHIKKVKGGQITSGQGQSLEQRVCSTANHHTWTGRTTCALRVRRDVQAEAEGTAALRHLEGEERLEKVHPGPHTRQHVIRLSDALEQPESPPTTEHLEFNIHKSQVLRQFPPNA